MKIRENVPISELTTMRLGGAARYVIEIEEDKDLAEAYHFAAEKNLPTYVLGGGSNVIGRDGGYNGVDNLFVASFAVVRYAFDYFFHILLTTYHQ